MPDKLEKSREQWHQEIVARQQNITPADFPEGVHYAKIAGLPRIVSQARFWIGMILAAIGVSLWHSAVPTFLTLAAIVGGLLLAISAMRL